ncbi:MAG: hypothetical protein AAF789_11155 [Bacteroidota bacterium]
MRRISLVVFLIVGSQFAFSQVEHLPLTVSYYAPFGTHLGVRIGTTFVTKSWEIEQDEFKIKKEILANTQVGFFSRPSISQNYLLNGEVGLRRSSTKRKVYWAVLGSLSYLNTVETIGGSLNLGTGEFSKTTEMNSSIIPQLNLEIGSNKQKKATFFYRIFYGKKIPFTGEVSGFFGLEIGARILFARKK